MALVMALCLLFSLEAFILSILLMLGYLTVLGSVLLERYEGAERLYRHIRSLWEEVLDG